MRRLASLCLAILAAVASPAAAQVIAYEGVADEVVYSEDLPPGDAGDDVAEVAGDGAGWRYVQSAPADLPAGIARYGPFRVLDAARAALVDVTDEASPAAFAALLRDWPGIVTLEMIECPGTEDDRANMRLGRMIHARGIATHVPDGGSVRSGGVELFLAGVRRRADAGAEFAVHAWADEDGRSPQDYGANAPENRAYIDYYREMGMAPAEASAFYAMTNSVPFEDARWLTAADMRRWVRLD